MFEYSVQMHSEEIQTIPASQLVKRHLSDTTVQENNTTFPTGSKLCKKAIGGCNKIAEEAEIKLRCSYLQESKQLLPDSYNAKHPQRAKQAKKARKRLKTIGKCADSGLETHNEPCVEIRVQRTS